MHQNAARTSRADSPALGRLAPAQRRAVAPALASGGQPLDAGARTAMAARFGHDFSQVRIHTDDRAVASASALDARAYAIGSDLVFGQNAYEPSGPEGAFLLAHELAHVVQNERFGPAAAGISDQDNASEREAHGSARAALSGQVPLISAAPGAAISMWPAWLSGAAETARNFVVGETEEAPVPAGAAAGGSPASALQTGQRALPWLGTALRAYHLGRHSAEATSAARRGDADAGEDALGESLLDLATGIPVLGLPLSVGRGIHDHISHGHGGPTLGQRVGRGGGHTDISDLEAADRIGRGDLTPHATGGGDSDRRQRNQEHEQRVDAQIAARRNAAAAQVAATDAEHQRIFGTHGDRINADPTAQAAQADALRQRAATVGTPTYDMNSHFVPLGAAEPGTVGREITLPQDL